MENKLEDMSVIELKAKRYDMLAVVQRIQNEGAMIDKIIAQKIGIKQNISAKKKSEKKEEPKEIKK